MTKSSVREIQQRHWKLGIYLLPIVGAIPAVWTLYRDCGDRDEKNASRLAINLVFVWIASYILLSLSVQGETGLFAFRLLYINALITSGYFLTCTFLMFRLRKGDLPHLPKIE